MQRLFSGTPWDRPPTCGRCGAGGTVKDGIIELQGDKVAAAEAALKAIGYKTRKG